MAGILKVAVYISGSIAAYKVTNLVRMLVKNNFMVRIAMTHNAEKFITADTLATLSQHYVLSDFDSAKKYSDFIPHINLSDWCDFAIVVPATANIIGKLANGIADDIVTTSLLATNKMKLVVPAMNSRMWNSNILQDNLQKLSKNGYEILEPCMGFLAEGYVGKGRMPEIDKIFDWIKQNIKIKKILDGVNLLITAGSTEEPIDPVRYISNRSSGKMGISLAKVARRMGANVTLIVGQTRENIPSDIHVINIRTFNDLKKALKNKFIENDVLIMAAAVSDYHVTRILDKKIKSVSPTINLTLEKNPNLLKLLAKEKNNQLLVGFAAETNDLLKNAQYELLNKNVDMIVANDVSRDDIGFGSDYNEVYIIEKDHTPYKINKASKDNIAFKILSRISNILKLRKEGRNN